MLQRISTTAREGKRRAFTLIELIVVIIIIGIIAAIAVPTYNQVIGNSKDSTLTASAQAFDRDFLAIAAFDAAQSSTGDPRVSNDPSGVILTHSGVAAVHPAYVEDNLTSYGYTVCPDVLGTMDVTACTAGSSNDAASGGYSWLVSGTVGAPDYRAVEFVKAGHYACLVLGGTENTPGTVTAGPLPSVTGTLC